MNEDKIPGLLILSPKHRTSSVDKLSPTPYSLTLKPIQLIPNSIHQGHKNHNPDKKDLHLHQAIVN
jgi:hypothetical protein